MNPFLKPCGLALAATVLALTSVQAQSGSAAPARKAPVRRPEPNSISVGAGYGVFGVGYALSLEYQLILGKEGLASIVIPVTWSQSKVTDAPTNGRTARNSYGALFAAPGILYHPGGAYEAVDFSIGAQVAIGELTARSNAYWGGPYELSSTFIAPMGALNLVFRSRRSNTIFGFHVAVGPTVQGNFGYSASGSAAESPVFFEGGIRLGGYF